jgi:predicted negative regulator of RcsB-dependent stress response
MSATSLTLRVFLSSPGDVAEERGIARSVMEELEGGHLLKGKVRFEIAAWDDAHAAAPMDARETPQASVNRYTGRPADGDLTVVIVWSRIGTPLPPGLARTDGTPYQSGTVWEYEDALSADKPVFVYRRTATPQIDLDASDFEARRQQYQAVKEFFGRFMNPDGSLRAGFNVHADAAGFQRQLRQHLEAFVNERLAGTPPVVAPDDPRVSQIATLIDELGRKNQQIDENASEIARLTRENEELRRAAIARTLTAAAQPDASREALAAADALEAGNTIPAEALLRTQEREEVAQIGSPEVDDATWRRQAAELAREQGALAMGHDVRVALEAYRRAAEYEPADTWTHFFIGDLYLRLGSTDAAMQSYRQAAASVERRLQANANDLGGQRDLSVSHNKIGDVLVAQGDGPGALAAYRKGLAIAEALAARDPANTEWQRDLSVSHNKIGDVLVAQGDGPGALAAYRKGLAIREALAARDAANAQWQTDVVVSCAKLGALDHGQRVDTRLGYLLRGRDILVQLKEAGRLMPNQDWIGWFEEQIAQLPPDQT